MLDCFQYLPLNMVNTQTSGVMYPWSGALSLMGLKPATLRLLGSLTILIGIAVVRGQRFLYHVAKESVDPILATRRAGPV